jgi:hypothetical protein
MNTRRYFHAMRRPLLVLLAALAVLAATIAAQDRLKSMPG